MDVVEVELSLFLPTLKSSYDNLKLTTLHV